MVRVQIKPRSLNELLDFARENANSPCHVDVEHGQFTVDGASILGLFAINFFGKGATVTIIGADADCEALLRAYTDHSIEYIPI